MFQGPVLGGFGPPADHLDGGHAGNAIQALLGALHHIMGYSPGGGRGAIGTPGGPGLPGNPVAGGGTAPIGYTPGGGGGVPGISHLLGMLGLMPGGGPGVIGTPGGPQFPGNPIVGGQSSPPVGYGPGGGNGVPGMPRPGGGEDGPIPIDPVGPGGPTGGPRPVDGGYGAGGVNAFDLAQRGDTLAAAHLWESRHPWAMGQLAAGHDIYGVPHFVRMNLHGQGRPVPQPPSFGLQ